MFVCVTPSVPLHDEYRQKFFFEEKVEVLYVNDCRGSTITEVTDGAERSSPVREGGVGGRLLTHTTSMVLDQ